MTLPELRSNSLHECYTKRMRRRRDLTGIKKQHAEEMAPLFRLFLLVTEDINMQICSRTLFGKDSSSSDNYRVINSIVNNVHKTGLFWRS